MASISEQAQKFLEYRARTTRAKTPVRQAGKTCSTCQTWKTLREFAPRLTAYDGREGSCRLCTARRHAERRQNPDYHKRRIELRHAREVERHRDAILYGKPAILEDA